MVTVIANCTFIICIGMYSPDSKRIQVYQEADGPMDRGKSGRVFQLLRIKKTMPTKTAEAEERKECGTRHFHTEAAPIVSLSLHFHNDHYHYDHINI